MFCPNCGAMNDDSSRFCSSCGAPLIQAGTTDQNPFEGNGTADASTHGNDDRRDSYQYDYTGQSTTPGTDSTGYENAGYAAGSTYGNQQYSGQQYSGQQYTGQQYAGSYQTSSAYSYGIVQRSIAVAIILSIVTCGIYSIYWMYKINEEMNQLSNDPTATGGGMVILLTIVTCGIYGVYWAYRMGEKNDLIKGVNGSSAILMLILSLVGLQLINFALLQDTINRAI